MRTLVILLAVFLLPARAVTQNKTWFPHDSFLGTFFITGKYDVGINIFAADGFQFDENNRHWIPGLFFRRYYDQNVFRASVEFRQQFYGPSVLAGPANANHTDQYSREGRMNRYDVRAGYERMFLLRRATRVQPYLYSELGGHYIVDNGRQNVLNASNTVVMTPSDMRTLGFGITSGAGLRWRMIANLYLVLEADVYWYIERTKGVSDGYDSKYGFHKTFNHIRTAGLSWLL